MGNVADKSAEEAQRAEPLRIVHVVSSWGIGGTEQGIQKVIAGLGSGSFAHYLCLIRGIAPNAPQVDLASSPVVAGDAREGQQFLIPRLRRIFRQIRPHVVHSRNWAGLEAVPAARLARVPVVIHSEHGYEVEMLRGMVWRRRVLRRALYPLAHEMFTVTRELRAYHARQAWLPESRFQVIYNGVDTQRFHPDAEARTRLRRELGIPEQSFLIGSVGRMVPIKDFGTILKAADALNRAGKETRVLLVGDGPELARLQQLAVELPSLAGKAVFAGASARVPEYLQALDAFVLSSLREGMSNTLLEAMATGLPLVATRAGGNPELVEEGRCGWFFQPGEAHALASHLERLHADASLRAQFGHASRRRALAVFSLERMIENYGQLYREAARRRGVLCAAGRPAPENLDKHTDVRVLRHI